MTDVAIIGGGPAALGSALYAARSGLSVTVFEKKFIGGQAATTHAVDNYLGFSSEPSGPDLIEMMQNHVSKFPVEFKHSAVKSLDLSGDIKIIHTKKNSFEAKSVILAMGAVPRALGLPGEEHFRGSGISYCATCDGMFFKGKDVAVVGGGDTAVGDALYLAEIANKVYLIHRRNEFRASPLSVERLHALSNVEIVTEAVVTDLNGDGTLSSITVSAHGESRTIEVSALFVAVGIIPSSEIVSGAVKLDDGGFIITDENMATNIPGVFAAGDIRKKPLRQIVTAVSDGAVAATSAVEYIKLK